jgi:hypothetical protein
MQDDETTSDQTELCSSNPITDTDDSEWRSSNVSDNSDDENEATHDRADRYIIVETNALTALLARVRCDCGQPVTNAQLRRPANATPYVRMSHNICPIMNDSVHQIVVPLLKTVPNKPFSELSVATAAACCATGTSHDSIYQVFGLVGVHVLSPQSFSAIRDAVSPACPNPLHYHITKPINL